MIRKPFDPELALYGERAESVIEHWLYARYGDVVKHADGKFGVDFGCEYGRMKVEVERRGPQSWRPYEYFPFQTFNVPARRKKNSAPFLVISTNKDFSMALVVFWYSLTQSRLTTKANREMPRGDEGFYDVPMHECLEFSLKDSTLPTIEEMNLVRVRRQLASYNDNVAGVAFKRKILGETPPFGMTRTEWEARHDEAEQPLLEARWADNPEEVRRKLENANKRRLPPDT